MRSASSASNSEPLKQKIRRFSPLYTTLHHYLGNEGSIPFTRSSCIISSKLQSDTEHPLVFQQFVKVLFAI